MNMLRWKWMLILVGTMLCTQLACGLFEIMEETLCEGTGGTWVPARIDNSMGIMIEEDGYCNRPERQEQEGQTGVEEQGTEGENELATCLVDPADYEWMYENLDTSEEGDVHGGRCRQEFILTNTGYESIIVVYNDAFDNNAMDSEIWKQWWLEPGQQDSQTCSYTWRPEDPDGDTYSYVSQILVIRNTPDCMWITDPAQQILWESEAVSIPAPCH
jgi:hypothetical protein